MLVLLAAGLAGFVLRAHTPAGGGTWTAVDGPHLFIHALARAPWGTLYAATGRGVYASTDRGATWRPAGTGFPGPRIEAWAVATLSGGTGGGAVLAVAASGGLYRLTRGDRRWTQVGTPPGAQNTYALFALPAPGAVLAGADNGIARSSDGGRSWTLVASLPGSAVVAFARDPAAGTLYAGLATSPHPLRVSHDGGYTWSIPSTATPPPSVTALLVASGAVYAGVMGPPGGQAVWAQGAQGFTSVSAGLPHTAHGMALAVADNRLLVGTMGAGVYGKAGQGAWTPLGQAPDDGVIAALLVLPGHPTAVLAGTDNGIYRLQLP
jgi:hypothetical protein